MAFEKWLNAMAGNLLAKARRYKLRKLLKMSYLPTSRRSSAGVWKANNESIWNGYIQH